MHRIALPIAVPISLLAGSAGCSAILGLDDVTVGGAPADALPDAAVCLGDGLLRVCLAEAPSSKLVVSGLLTFDTSADQACLVRMSGSTEVCVLAHDSIEIGTTMRVIGVRPLVLVAMTSISVDGLLDVSSARGKGIGAGGNSAACNQSPNSPGSYDGGAGGSFGSRGGDGGDSEGNGRNMAATPTFTIDSVHGGCRGRDGDATSATIPRGGAGGGGVYLIAKDLITIDGAINASGAGGDGGLGNSDGNGGGGGGSGGLIGLEAPFIGGTGAMFANGAGGGGGGAVSTGGNGAESTGPTVIATGGGAGGVGTGSGGAGGNGPPGGFGGTGSVGGGSGGGGGGAGIIFIKGPMPATIAISPPPKVQP